MVEFDVVMIEECIEESFQRNLFEFIHQDSIYDTVTIKGDNPVSCSTQLLS